jgi:WD40 repeat protein
VNSFKEALYGITFSPDNRRLAIAARYEPLKVWDLGERQFISQLLGHTALITSVHFCSDGWRLLSASEDATVRLWDAAQSSDHDRLEGHNGKVRAVAFNRDGNTLASVGADDNDIVLWSNQASQPFRVFRTPRSGIFFLAFSSDGEFLAESEGGGHLRLRHVDTGREIVELVVGNSPPTGVAWSPAGDRVAIRTVDGAIRIVEARSGQTVARCSSVKGQSGSIGFSHNGRLLVTAHDDCSVRVWQADTLSPVYRFLGHTAPVVKVIFDPKNLLVGSSSNDHTIRLWDATSGKHLHTLTGHNGTPTGLAFSNDGLRLASCSTDQTVKIWNVTTGLELQSLIGHNSWVRDVAFSSDSQHLATAGYDGLVRVWHAPTKPYEPTATREAAALVRYRATRASTREQQLAAIKADDTINDEVRANAINQAKDILFYWAQMVAGHRAATSGDWLTASDAFGHATDIAPDDVMLWYWLALTSFAANRGEAYQQACNELLLRCGPTADPYILELTLGAWLIPPPNGRRVDRVIPVVIDSLQKRLSSNLFRWLFQLRSGTIPGDLIDPSRPLDGDDSAEVYLIQSMALQRAGYTAKALFAYQTAIRRARSRTPFWITDVWFESLRREVESKLPDRWLDKLVSPPGATPDFASSSDALQAEERHDPPSNAVVK